MLMAVFIRFMLFLVLAFQWAFNTGAAQDCVLKESCTLPCSFRTGDNLVIHWIRQKDGTTIHSYYYEKNQLDQQPEAFKDRTKLFEDQFSQGNASLRLTGITIEDQGSYKCYTSTISDKKESIIHINVEAPSHKVDIKQVGNKIICSSEGLYPKPELIWSSTAPSSLPMLDKPEVHQNEELLYSISSSLIVQNNDSEVDYNCTITSGRNNRSAIFFKQTSITATGATTIPCTPLNVVPKILIWKFNGKVILNQTKATVSEEWKKHVKDVSKSGGLILQDLTQEQEGAYMCEINTAEETYASNTVLSVQKAVKVGGIVAGVVVPLVALCLGVGIWVYSRRILNILNKTTKSPDTELQEQRSLQSNGEAR